MTVSRDTAAEMTGQESLSVGQTLGIQPLLNGHGPLRVQEHLIAIDRRAERHARFRYLAQLPQAEHLKTAGIGQDRTVPAHETV